MSWPTVDPDEHPPPVVEGEVPDRATRCRHGRYRVDPCPGCARHYEGGVLVGRFEVAG